MASKRQKQSFINYFKFSVRMSVQSRHTGHINAAKNWESIIDSYYEQAKDWGSSEEELLAIEETVQKELRREKDAAL